MESLEQVGFYSYEPTFIVDNSENAHICSEEYMFTDKINPISSNVVATISGQDIIPKVIVTVSCPFTDYDGQLHTNKLNN